MNLYVYRNLKLSKPSVHKWRPYGRTGDWIFYRGDWIFLQWRQIFYSGDWIFYSVDWIFAVATEFFTVGQIFTVATAFFIVATDFFTVATDFLQWRLDFLQWRLNFLQWRQIFTVATEFFTVATNFLQWWLNFFTVATEFCAMAPNIWGHQCWIFLRVTLLAPRRFAVTPRFFFFKVVHPLFVHFRTPQDSVRVICKARCFMTLIWYEHGWSLSDNSGTYPLCFYSALLCSL